MKISEIYNMDIYSDGGQYLGEVRDAIIDLERGEVSRLLMEEWRNADKEEVKRLLQQKSIIFKNIKSIEDVVLVSTGNQYKKSESDNASEVSDLTNR
ncbi:MAG: PRC-barrel domain-containing protein [Candidatus Micrarchaeia archaeon]